MQNKVVANILNDISQIKKALGANKFSVGAYIKAAIFVENLSVPIESVDLENTKGIGPKIAAHIKELLQTGKIQFVEDNRQYLSPIPKQSQLTVIEGIGEKTAQKIEEFGIHTVEELKKALEENRLDEIFGEKTILQIKKGIDYLEKTKGRIRLDQGIELALRIYSYMQPYVDRIEFCGSLRRSRETVGDVDFAITSKQFNVLTVFKELPIVDEVIDSGDKKVSVWMDGVRVDCYLFEPEFFESGVMHLTGSADHNERLRAIAKSKGWILSQYGLYVRGEDDKRTDERIDDGTEIGIYRALGFEFIPPEHRDDPREFHKYQLGKTVPLLTIDDITADWHVHSVHSDSKSTIEDNVRFAIEKGLKTIAICDHSEHLKIANGLTVERLIQRNLEIDALRLKYPQIKILKGMEVEIRSDGSLDYSDDVLDSLDFVIAALHVRSQKDVTEIYKKVICSGKVHTIAHLTGRMINEREGHIINIEEVLQECKRCNVAIELNCSPKRLDVDEKILKRCKTLGIKITFGSDAHEKSQISYVKSFGLWIAKRAWLTKEDLYEK